MNKFVERFYFSHFTQAGSQGEIKASLVAATMVSFWGAKKNDSGRVEEPSREQGESHEQVQNANAPAQAHEEEPTERTRLLPRDESQGFLSPDDPAVR